MKREDIRKLSNPLFMYHIQWLPKTAVKWGNTVYGQILSYKDARVDMERLDEVCGSDWQNEYKRDTKGVLQCGIGIYIDELSDWVWRWSNGVPSDFESEKGEYSDAMKRAGFMWGIGRELYDCPNIRVPLNDKEFKEVNGKVKTTGYFRP